MCASRSYKFIANTNKVKLTANKPAKIVHSVILNVRNRFIESSPGFVESGLFALTLCKWLLINKYNPENQTETDKISMIPFSMVVPLSYAYFKEGGAICVNSLNTP